MAEPLPLLALLEAGLSRGGLQTDDVLAVTLPLLREVAALHEQGQVAQLEGAASYRVTEAGTLALLRAEGAAPTANREAIERLQAPAASVLRVLGETRVTHEADAGLVVDDLRVDDAAAAATGDAPVPPARPAYLPGYRAWEQRLGHHDAASDILCLGQVLASLACGLDFTSADDLRLFAANRENLFRLQERLHPVLAGVIGEMTELDRHRRAQDLPSLIRRLETYREQPRDLSLAGVVAPQDGVVQRRRAIQQHLRDRLFDLSRRNRLLHFRPTQSSVNLTVASVPLVVDLKSIRLDQLCVWGGAFAADVLGGERVPLARWLRFEDQPYLPGSLDRIIQEARRDRAEYGFSQLSLVLAFLRWHNLKEDRDERIVSPLLLLPVDLARRKGVRDQYLLQADTTEAEVNPVLRQQLRQVYGIVLPGTLDLRSTSIEDFHAQLQAQIAATEPGVRLRLVTQPEIELVHQRARQRLEQFQRRQRVRAPMAAAPAAATDYSYSADDFRPLGLKLFHERVRPSPLPLRAAVGGAPAVRYPQMASHPASQPAADAAAQEAGALTFALRESSGNPYLWDLDLTAVTLGNFNYRKMSLVRDYNALVEADLANPAFDRVFSMQPRAMEAEAPAPLPLAEQWTVVPADATQAAAVALARGGTSYIIQGPPGTGKSQTITNLIADHVGRGRRVLFVCEKRAAIDVVFHRLRQQGLDELCCMIHDSQADKKAFVLNLKQTYEHWLNSDDGLDEAQRQRQALVNGIAQDTQALERFDAAMRAVPEHVGAAVRELVHRLVALQEQVAQAVPGGQPPLTPVQREALPAFAVWQRHGDLAERLQRTLAETVGAPSLAAHAFARLGEALVRHERPLARLAELTDQAEALIDRCGDALAQAWPDAPALRWHDVARWVAQARLLRGAAARGQLGLLDAASDWSGRLEAAVADLARLAGSAAAAAARTQHWREPLDRADAQAALLQAKAQEGAFWRVLLPSWWRLRKELQRRYDFARHAVRPQPSVVLGELVARHEADEALAAARAQFTERFGAVEPEPFVQMLHGLRDSALKEPAVAAFHRRLLTAAGGGDARTLVEALVALGPDADALAAALDELLTGADLLDLDALGEVVRDLREQADALPDLMPVLQELVDADPGLARVLRTLDLPAAAIEHAVAHESLERLYRSERWLPRFDGAVLARHVQRLGRAERQLFELNARSLRAAARRRFRENVQRSTLALSQLDADGKLFKKAYSAGRRELEHEFGKTMRYKSIRDLASADSGRVVRDMKPIWLMSPLSVSDTLPLAADLFDVVIFDEASQIPVEEAVPALYRAPQVIVVGDEMQLPPTSFFSAARDGEDGDGELAVDDEGERLAVVLDADSLLNQGARNLPATLLAWHYRSRYESLIGYSNAAFYAGNLYTIPDRSLPAGDQGEIVVHGAEVPPEAAAAHADALLSRAISFHAVADAVYANRRNEGEARHIARLVRELLNRDTGRSIGVVAFSEAQQGEIEAALNELGSADPAFAQRLEAEYVREEDDQFCGLFVKNLENVQGDERDIIILSICYGRGPDGRMLMNFGPINQRGGEKRLNVIFSRARHHMAVVSSIRHDAITNDYNEGAAALKQFLRYAEQASRGNRGAAQQVLEGLNPVTRKALAGLEAADPVARQLAAALKARGHAVDAQVGQSRFRCDLGIRDPRDGHYALAVLVDSAAHYANRDVFERYVSRPRILGAFGWRVIQVLSRDWYHEPQAVLDRIERALQEAPVAEAVQAGEAADDAVLAVAVPEAPPTASAPVGAAQPLAPAAADPAALAAPMAATAPAAAPALVRRFECTEGSSRKFWQVSQRGTDVTVNFGRIGTQGQTQLKQFGTGQRAQQEVQKLVAEKLKRGYVEIPPA
jgi:predicted DNA-binding WGR domain protein